MKVIMMTSIDVQTNERTITLFAKPQRAWDELVEVADYIGVRCPDDYEEGSLESLTEGGIVRVDNGEAILTLEWVEVHE